MIPRFGHILTLACLTAGSLVTLDSHTARAQTAADLSAGRIRIEPGQDPEQALRAAALAARLQRLRANWLATGHSLAEVAKGAPLALTSGTVLSNTIRIGDPLGFASLSFGFTAGISGLAGANFTFSAPVGPKTVLTSYDTTTYTKAGTASFAYPVAFPFYAAPGTWTLTSATLYDNAGNTTTYTASQLAALFTSNTLTVINHGPVDDEAPVLGVGHLLNTTVSLSATPLPQLKATLAVSDAGTGVNQALLFIEPPGQSYYYAQLITIPLPVKSGTVRLYDTFYPNDAVGTWTIPEYMICDAALNCNSSMDPAAIFKLFGANSFTVTQ